MILGKFREGALIHDIYNPGLNSWYRDALARQDVISLSCKVRYLDRKGRVEHATLAITTTNLNSTLTCHRKRPSQVYSCLKVDWSDAYCRSNYPSTSHRIPREALIKLVFIAR